MPSSGSYTLINAKIKTASHWPSRTHAPKGSNLVTGLQLHNPLVAPLQSLCNHTHRLTTYQYCAIFFEQWHHQKRQVIKLVCLNTGLYFTGSNISATTYDNVCSAVFTEQRRHQKKAVCSFVRCVSWLELNWLITVVSWEQGADCSTTGTPWMDAGTCGRHPTPVTNQSMDWSVMESVRQSVHQYANPPVNWEQSNKLKYYGAS